MSRTPRRLYRFAEKSGRARHLGAQSAPMMVPPERFSYKCGTCGCSVVGSVGAPMVPPPALSYPPQFDSGVGPFRHAVRYF